MSILLQEQVGWRPKTARASVLSAIMATAKKIVGWPLRVHANRTLLGRMAGMSAHELADIGLTPNDVADTAALSLDSDVGRFLATRAEARRPMWRGRAP